MLGRITLLLVALLAFSTVDARARLMSLHPLPKTQANTPGTADCTQMWYSQRLDHFTFAGTPTMFNQRYFTCMTAGWTPGKPVFFYTGNEANVELYVNATGLMWQNAARFGAMLIFIEHRFFGQSLPYPGQPMPSPDKLIHLTTDQALADYATFIDWFRTSKNAQASAFIGFGGSYGGMLCSWLRIKYPSSLDGCIAGSAPIANFLYMNPPYNNDGFAMIETFDASTAGGSNDMCKTNIRQVWNDMMSLGQTGAGLQQIGAAFATCTPLRSMNDVYTLMNWAEGAIGNMAMGSYPYPSGYMLLGGGGQLPAYPLRVACNYLTQTFATPTARMAAMSRAMGVFYNVSGTMSCNNINGQVNQASVIIGYLWDYLYCTTMFMPSATNGVTDMFWDSPWNTAENVAYCQQSWNGVTPQADWVKINYGGRGVGMWGSNIVFSNGELDPWRPGGIQSATAPGIKTVIIPDCGHHADLFFSTPQDPPGLTAARQMEVTMIGQWIAQRAQQMTS